MTQNLITSYLPKNRPENVTRTELQAQQGTDKSAAREDCLAQDTALASTGIQRQGLLKDVDSSATQQCDGTGRTNDTCQAMKQRKRMGRLQAEGDWDPSQEKQDTSSRIQDQKKKPGNTKISRYRATGPKDHNAIWGPIVYWITRPQGQNRTSPSTPSIHPRLRGESARG